MAATLGVIHIDHQASVKWFVRGAGGGRHRGSKSVGRWRRDEGAAIRALVIEEHSVNPSCLALTTSSNNPPVLSRKTLSRIRSHRRARVPLTLGQLSLTSPLPSTRLHSNMTPLDSGACLPRPDLSSCMMTLLAPLRSNLRRRRFRRIHSTLQTYPRMTRRNIPRSLSRLIETPVSRKIHLQSLRPLVPASRSLSQIHPEPVLQLFPLSRLHQRALLCNFPHLLPLHPLSPQSL